ncbi:MAG: ammonia-forming cytochrome c nitrite reductase subunit c552 [Gemmatales bacterium]|nr:ammonia-forming cytochrome c nitrite reductase subunit c552 [Gemmatales bacterium]
MSGAACSSPSRWRWLGYTLTIAITAVATIGILALWQNIAERKREARETVFRVVEISEDTIDPAIWGQNFPRQYDTYRRTVDTERTKHGGSEAFQKLEKDPRLKVLFQGFPFSVDYREERGHAYMLQDPDETERLKGPQRPGGCLHCHSSSLGAMYQLGVKAGVPRDEDQRFEAILRGFEVLCSQSYWEVRPLVEHPVSCVDCHDPKTLALRITRPAFIYAIRALARSDDPVPHLPSIERWRQSGRRREYDPNVEASRQELRSMVCAQCHVEYYFKPPNRLLVYPWHHGLKMEQIEAYYDAESWKDWTHPDTGAALLKAQHPEFELWSQGVHARAGVACADCHMPYRREGAIKISDHHVRSPLLNVARACQTCHPVSETELLARATAIQDRTAALLDRAENALIDLITALSEARKAGVDDARLKEAQRFHRQAQWRLDFVLAENSTGFHAPQESARILAEAIDLARQGQLATWRARLTDKRSSSANQSPHISPVGLYAR